MKPLALTLLFSALAAAELVDQVKIAATRQDFAAAERMLAAHPERSGEYLEAYSWLGRGALAGKQWDRAAAYAAETRKLALAELKRRPLDAERHLPIALGAAIEVEANVLAGTGRRSEALALLQRDLKSYYATSIRTRIQKNINLLSLEGQPAPALDLARFLPGPRLASMASLAGHPYIVFFWAHWCADCKQQGPVLTALRRQFPKLRIVAPTQHYGYVAGGEEAPPAVEERWMEAVRQHYYADLLDVPAPVSEENFRRYGSSTSPTLVLVDATGRVRLYHPGRMSAAELVPYLQRYAQ